MALADVAAAVAASGPVSKSTSRFRWGLIGPGGIARRFAGAVRHLPACSLVAVAGRRRERAQAFADAWADGDATIAVASSIPELLARTDLDAVYVATPHAFHPEAVHACLDAGLPVLCEKPLAPTAAQARAMVAHARERGVLLMEAMWTSFLPVYAEVARWLQRGAIGELRAMQSSFGLSNPFDAHHRCYDAAQAGGALLDIGIYNLAVTRWVLEQAQGRCPDLSSVQAHAVLAPTGVDQRLSAQLQFDGGVVAQMFCAFDTVADNSFRIQGEGGSIVMPTDFWQATRAALSTAGGESVQIDCPFDINGFEGEILEAMRCVRAGQIESACMPHAETLALADWMDGIRRQVGVRYPFEPETP